LYTLPTRLKKSDERDKWIRLISRQATQGNKFLSPSKDARVCSLHFVGGEKTEEHPYPTEKLGYDGFREKVFISFCCHRFGKGIEVLPKHDI